MEETMGHVVRVEFVARKERTIARTKKDDVEAFVMSTQGCYVFDIGSEYIRGGYAGDVLPRVEVLLRSNSRYHYRKSEFENQNEKTESHRKETYMSSLPSCDVSKSQCIVKDGRILDVRQLEYRLTDCFTKLSCPTFHGSKDHTQDASGFTAESKCIDSVTLCMSSFTSSLIPLFNSSSTRTNPLEQLIDWLFTTKRIKRCQLVTAPLMSLYAIGAVSGLVVDVGKDSSRITPIGDGKLFRENCQSRVMKGGGYITEALQRQLCEKRQRVATPYCILEKIKKETFFVSQDYQRDRQLAEHTSVFHREWILPDRTRIALNEERFTEPEQLFSLRHENYGFFEGEETLPTAIGEAIHCVPVDLRRPLLKVIVLCGGGSLLPGFPSRLDKEVRSWYSTHIMKLNGTASLSELTTNVVALPEREWLVFRGASLYSSLSSAHHDAWVTREAYVNRGLTAFELVSKRSIY